MVTVRFDFEIAAHPLLGPSAVCDIIPSASSGHRLPGEAEWDRGGTGGKCGFGLG